MGKHSKPEECADCGGTGIRAETEEGTPVEAPCPVCNGSGQN
ncbi:hypothetical protein BTM25_33440 [Actinomadura rubteroloni]|uniref:Molecular chaperone DnaJ n=1 Tax=Actinomadura rubteroloni TaxID=1926885 RepID=A0A2P4UI30_9ACTN|nr:hypothetical protein BTM25_33440 [Actinomadura rubteroloni]